MRRQNMEALFALLSFVKRSSVVSLIYDHKMLSFLDSVSVSLDKMLTKLQSCQWIETSWRSSDATLIARFVDTRTDSLSNGHMVAMNCQKAPKFA